MPVQVTRQVLTDHSATRTHTHTHTHARTHAQTREQIAAGSDLYQKPTNVQARGDCGTHTGLSECHVVASMQRESRAGMRQAEEQQKSAVNEWECQAARGFSPEDHA